MATLLLSAVGGAIGASFGGTVLGLSGAVIGRAIGATVGRAIDQRILGGGSEVVETGRTERLRLHSTGEGAAIPEVWGRMRVSGHVIWASEFLEHQTTTTQSHRGGKGGGGGASTTTHVTEYSYSVSFAMGLCRGVIARLGRIWADGVEIAPSALNLRLYHGDEDQLPDAKIVAIEGAARVPAFRGLAYVVFEDFDLTPYGNRLPQLSFEVFRNAQGPGLGEERVLSDVIHGVDVIPGTGEYALAVSPVYLDHGAGRAVAQNLNTPSGLSDFQTSLQQMKEELPNLRSVGLVVSWFGDDLRCGTCQIQPKVEQKQAEGIGMAWRAGGIGRAAAATVPRREGRVIYGGTPTDQSVIEAIRAIRHSTPAREVMFYPFILMDQLAGNGRANPWGTGEQPVMPWRGRITASKAPGLPDSPQGTAQIRAEVAAFLGTCSPADFAWVEGELRYSGPNEWRYRRFILHYAHLCAAAGGVDSFCIGSEMVALTRLMDETGAFPAVEALMVLAGEVRAILGPDCQISYAADWTEYGAYVVGEDVHFPLDPLWAHEAISFVGIDNYMPLADWREGESHLDAQWQTPWNLDYLCANIAGGEGYEWYYDSAAGEAAQRRLPIEDGAYGEPWVFRVKDLRGWWENLHHPRHAGARAENPTAWVPGSKPIRFTEYGCAALDKGANQPNKFLDLHSSESALPRHSNGGRDDVMQMQYLRAMHRFWTSPETNPPARAYAGRMVDWERAHVWAWDARPYPAFPERTDLWGDAPAYRRGHWLTGRVMNQPIAAVLREMAYEAGLQDIDTGAAYGLVRGYVLRDLETTRAKAQPLMQIGGLDAFEARGALRFRSRLAGVDHHLGPMDLAVDQAEGLAETIRASAEETGTRLRLTYTEAEGAYEARLAESRHPDEPDLRVAQSEVAVALTQSEAQGLVARWLAESRIGRDRLRLSLLPNRHDVEVSDRFRWTDGSLWRVERAQAGETRKIEAVRVESGIYTAQEPDLPAPTAPRYHAPTPVSAQVFDVPLLRGDENPIAPYIAVTAEPWPGTVAVWGEDVGGGFRVETRLRQPALMGVSLSDLAHSPAHRWARGAVLDVRLMGGALASRTRAHVLNGANAVAIGGGEGAQWEVVQFAKATLIGPDQWRLSDLLRGQAGSDAVMPALWPAGAQVIVLNDAISQLEVAPAQRGWARRLRVGSVRLRPEDPAMREVMMAAGAVGLRPYSVAHLRARGGEAGALEVTWCRRGRIDSDSWEGFEIPLGEEREAYRVEIWAGGLLRARYETGAPIFVYTEARRLLDGVGTDFRLNVSQLSQIYGPGPGRDIVITL